MTGAPAVGVTVTGSGLDRMVAWLVAGAAAAQAPWVGPLSPAVLVCGAFLPVWLPELWRNRRARLAAVLMLAAIVNGLVVGRLMEATHDNAPKMAFEQSLLMLGMLLGIGGLIWAARLIGQPKAAMAYGLGLLANAVVHGFDSSNVWKFTLSIPIVVLGLGWAWWRASRAAEVTVLLVLIAISALNDSRSAASILLVVLTLVLWQLVRTSLNVRSTLLRATVTVSIVVLGAYNLMQLFILEGFLGQGAKARSEAQIASTGSILLGGRPEIGAAVALLREYPGGMGLGTLPTFGDVYIAKGGMYAVNYDPNNGYVENYMFGSRIEVHSVLGDLWLRFGVFGMAAAVAFLLIALIGALALIAKNRASAVVVFIAVQAAWETLFSPMYTTAAQVLTLAVGLLAAVGARDRAAPVAPAEAPSADAPLELVGT